MRRRLPAPGEGHIQRGLYQSREDITPDWNPDAQDTMSEAYSSSHTEYGDYYMPVSIHETSSIDERRSFVNTVPRWPNPSEGGEPGAGNQLGWTKGIQHRRWHTTPFKGGHITLKGNKAHDTRGPVGRRDFLGSLAQRVPYQFVEISPTPQEVATAFTFAPSHFADEWAAQNVDSDLL